MQSVYIVSVARTPVGSFNGILSSLSATQLGAIAIKGALAKAKVDAMLVNEVFMGNVVSANLGQAPARQAAKFAGLPDHVICTTINKVCASGMKSIMLATQSIQLGINDIVIAGGMESMSNIPFYLDKARNGYKLGHGQLIDGILKDALWDVYNDYHMGNAAENTAKEMQITRVQQDEYAIQSYLKAAKAWSAQKFKEEIVAVEVPQRNKESLIVTEDEEYKNVNFEKIPALKPVFLKDGTVTAANASTLNDGASALVLVSEKALKQYNLTPLARIVSFADAEQAPEWFTTSPSIAIPKAMKLASLNNNQIDAFEINEAFSVVALANIQKLGIDPAKTNIYGGAVALGHPLGSSGSRIVCTLTSTLMNENGKFGVAGICNGGGGASAIVVEKI